MMKSLILSLLFSILISVHSITPKKDPLIEEYGAFPPKATFYDEEYFNGGSTITTFSEGAKCRDLPKRWKNRALSVDTQGTCVSLCPEVNCGGNCVRVYPTNGDLQLAKVGMSKKVVSMTSCF